MPTPGRETTVNTEITEKKNEINFNGFSSFFFSVFSVVKIQQHAQAG
jgi:hypothetical protein